MAVLSATGATAVTPAFGQETEAAATSGFTTRKQPAAVVEALQDFERYRDHKAWEKAFAALAKVADAAGGDRLLLGPDGISAPVSYKVRRELLTLPADGREAYRLFNDAKAQQLFQQATAAQADDPTAAPTDDVPLLRQVVDRYFITSVGDQAADRLGDALFEAGDFTAADNCWRMILDDYPDTTLPAPLLNGKRAVALADAGLSAEFEAVRATVHDRYGGQQVHIGGRDVEAVAFVDGLAAHVRRGPTTGPADDVAGGGASLVLPTSDTPAWQFPLMDAASSKAIEERLVGYGWGRLAGQILSAVPPAAADERRVYVNWFGACLAADLNTGKLLWRTASPATVTQGITNGVMQGNVMQPAGFGLVLAGDRVLITGRPPPPANGGGANVVTVVNGMVVRQGDTANLTCLEAATGKKLWSTAAGALSAWSFVGPPVIGGDAVYAVATNASPQGGSADYSLLTVGLADGALRSKVPLGTPQFPNDQFRGQPITRPPALLARHGKVYVLTNDGAVLAVDPAAGRLDWSYAYPPKVEEQNNYYYNFAVRPPPLAPAAMVVAGSTLYLKEQGTTTLYALDMDGPAVRWTRPVDPDAGLVGLAGGDLLMLGDSADAIDAGSRAMRWSNAVSVATGDVRPLVAGGHLYAFGKRGVHDVLLSDGTDAGPVFRGADRDSAGGLLLRAGDRLVTVSTQAVTAYPLGSTPGGH